MKIPVLMITHNRLEYTKKAFNALFFSEDVLVYVVDNGSTDGTAEWLDGNNMPLMVTVIRNDKNEGIAGAMNQFLNITQPFEYVGKVDNDTVVKRDWAVRLQSVLECYNLDIVQARHHIIPATHPGGWEGFVSKMYKIRQGLYEHHFVGGSGIVFRRSVVDKIPETSWKLGGWREFQGVHPELRKAFCEDVEVELLDAKGYDDYPEYYKTTKRL